MADVATEERTNTVTITDVGPSRKKLRIEVPAETVSERLEGSLDTLAIEAELPGFRKGRAPRSLIQKRFGSVVQNEAKKELIASAYAKAIEDNNLKVVGEPTGEGFDAIELQPGKPLAFEIEVEVMPEFDLPALEGIEIKKPQLEVTDAMVDEELGKIKINEGSLESRDVPEPGDYLTGHGVMKGPNDETFYDINGAVVQVPTPDKNGKGMILGIMVDDFAAQLGAPKAGETVTIKAKGPENHEVEGVRNADLVITFQVDRIDRIIPASSEQLVQAFGLESEQQIKDLIRARMQQRVQVQQQAAMRQQVAKHLIDNTTVELPERLTANQAARVLERQRYELMYRGMEPQQIEERMAELRAASGEAAQRDLKLFFILNKAADELKVRVEEAEINGRIAMMARERNVRPEQLRQEVIQRNQVGAIYQQIREHKTFDAIIAKAKVTEVPADEFNKQAEGEAKETKSKKKSK